MDINARNEQRERISKLTSSVLNGATLTTEQRDLLLVLLVSSIFEANVKLEVVTEALRSVETAVWRQ